LKKLKKIAKYEDIEITSKSPFPEEVIEERDKEYLNLSDIEFKKKYRGYLYTPVILELPDGKLKVQYNFCNNTFCKWYGQSQHKYENIKSKPSRYKLVSANDSEDSTIHCNDITYDTTSGVVLGNKTSTISNWSISEEIKRLITINSVVPHEPEYRFHKEGCKYTDKTPFADIEQFCKRGKSNTNSIKYQCKECKKITNVLPEQDECFNYHQKRNDILIQFAKDIISRTPVKRTCEKLGIGSATYYNKLEWLYKKCLEFNQRYETEVLKNREFDEIWINTDMFIYNLNNIRKKGHGGERTIGVKEKKMQTYAIASADLKTGYVFQSDIAYDYYVNLDEVENDTKIYHCDHSYPFLRKNDRLKYSYCPQTPTKFDSQSIIEYESELAEYDNRKKYVEGCHVKPQYTAIAHYFLLKRTINSKKWNFVSDDDSTLQSSIFRVFKDKFQSENALYFTCQCEKTLTLEESGKEAFRSRIELKNWARDNKLKNIGLWEIGEKKLASEVCLENLYDYIADRGINYPVRGSNHIMHPLPDKDEGIRWINLISYAKYLSNDELANLIMQVNSRAINNFFQEVRRKISILERPIVTARGDGKSYIYANYNPKYAQQMLTIFRTFYNFCWKTKVGNKKLTPAQCLGIANKAYDYKDIIYFR